jgi:hypothetical protein
MTWCHAAASLSALAAIAAAAGARPAAAAGRPCQPLAVETDAGVRAQWPEAPQLVRAAFAGRDDVDACARVALGMNGGSIAVKVVLLDGRATVRTVSQPEDVVPALQALLLVPTRPAAGRPVTLAAPPAATPAARVVADEPSRLAIELAVAVGARVGDGQTGGGVGALSFLDMGGWLLGCAGRADVYGPVGDAPPAAALELALLGGRRLRSGSLALDLVAGPALALEGTSITVTQPALEGRPLMRSMSEVRSGRLLFGARLNFRARSVLRTFVALDADIGSSGAAPDPSLEMGQLPVWTVGFTLGATVGTL